MFDIGILPYISAGVWLLAVAYAVYEARRMRRIRQRYERIIAEHKQAIDLYKVERADVKSYGRNHNGSKITTTQDRSS